MGMAYKNLSVKSDFSQMHPSRSGFDYELEHFARIDQIDWILDYECNHCAQWVSQRTWSDLVCFVYRSVQIQSKQRSWNWFKFGRTHSATSPRTNWFRKRTTTWSVKACRLIALLYKKAVLLRGGPRDAAVDFDTTTDNTYRSLWQHCNRTVKKIWHYWAHSALELHTFRILSCSNIWQRLPAAGQAADSWADYSNTSHGQWAETKNNILENKQLMEDSHTDPQPCVRSVPVESEHRWGSEE